MEKDSSIVLLERAEKVCDEMDGTSAGLFQLHLKENLSRYPYLKVKFREAVPVIALLLGEEEEVRKNIPCMKRWRVNHTIGSRTKVRLPIFVYYLKKCDDYRKSFDIFDCRV